MTDTPNERLARYLRQLGESDALRDLENRLAAQNTFNLFDAIGVSNQELRHSDFLAFLLRPHEAHGLDDAFLKWFLQTALSQSPDPPLPLTTLHEWDLSDARVRREGEHIDLFITSAKKHLAVIVENKIYTGEHSDQLTRYMDRAKAQGHDGPGRTLLGVYLTPHGGKASHPEYLPIGYEAICARLEVMCKTGAFDRAASPDVETTVRHYTRMLRRRIVGDPEITKICRDLYKKHQAAFDRVFDEVNGDTRASQKATTNQIKQWIENTAGFETSGTQFYRGISISHFVPKSWSNEKALLRSELPKWSVYLQTETYNNGKVIIAGIIAPCEPAFRTRLLQIVQTVSQSMSFDVGNGYTAFYTHTLRPPYFETEEQNDDVLHDAWNEWIETEGPKFTALIQPGDFPAD